MPLSTLAKQEFNQLLDNLPHDYQETAKQSKAFLRARKIKNPMELMHLVLMYCGIDHVLREKARRDCKKNSKSKNIKQETLMYAEWRMILTTVPPQALDTNSLKLLAVPF